MSAPSGNTYAVGTRYACIFELNENGSPAATNTTPYEGAQIVGARAFDLNIPDARRITHVGDDRPLQVDFLPPTEGVTGELRAARMDSAVYAILTGTEVLTVAEAKAVGIATSQQGSEPQVGLLLYQQAQDEAGARNWRAFIIPKATVYPHPSGMSENANEHRFLVAPSVVNAHLWETDFAAGTEGFTEAQVIKMITQYKPKIIAWLASTATTQFALPTATPAANTAKMAVFVDGSEQTSVTKATTQIAFQTAPGNSKRVVCFYEHA